MSFTLQHIEAIIFAGEHPVTINEMVECVQLAFPDEPVTDDDVKSVLNDLKTKYESDLHSFELVRSGGGYQFLTKEDYAPLIAQFLSHKSKRKLSTAAMEVLSIVAYKQPITKAEIEQIRGVSCDYTIQRLLEKDLVAPGGRADSPGRPILYTTSPNFMDHFGINSAEDLPKLKDLSSEIASEMGESPSIQESNDEA